MNVLHVISGMDPAGGGPPRALFGLACAQAEAGLSVEVVSTHAKAADLSLARQMRDRGVSVEMVGPVVGPLGWHRRLRSSVAAAVDRADVLHIHALWEQVQYEAARAARRGGKPYVIRPCGMLDPWSLAQSATKKRLYMAWRLRRMLDHAAALHFTTGTEQRLTEPLNIQTPGIIVPNGIDLAEFETLPTPGTFREKLDGVGDRPIVVFLSRVHHKKGLELLIPALAQCTTEGSEPVLVVAGPAEPAYQRQLVELGQRHGLTGDRLRFVGMLHGPDRIAALADADLFALTSHQENFGIAVVEALAAGTPVLISDQVNIHEAITEAGVGEATPLDIDAIAAALGRWLSEPDRRGGAAARARPFVWERFAWDQIAERWKQHYARLTTPPPTGPSPKADR